MIPLQAEEDLSVNVVLENSHITTSSQLMSTNPKYDIDKGYYLPITILLVNNTNKIKKIELGATCYGYSPWKVEGDLHFVEKEIHCTKNLSAHSIRLEPKEVYKKKLRLFFPISYFYRKLSFKIGFIETLYLYDDKLSYYKPIGTYWSKLIIINEKSKEVSNIK